MKLFPLLFLNEAQVFASQAYQQGYALVETNFESKITLVFINKNQMKDASGNLKQSGDGIVQGYISFIPPEEGDIAEVRSSSALEGWGPLLYQAAMKRIAPNWLASDTNLSIDANKVWNKCYELKNLYNRKYIGNVSSDRYECCVSVFSSIPSDEDMETEQDFLRFLQSQNVSPENTGCFWAYKKKTHEPEIDVLFREGNILLKTVGNEQIFEWINSSNLP